MGSFTELTLAFTFSSHTPPEVLSAFAPWRTEGEAPELAPFDDSLEHFADDHLSSYFGDDAAVMDGLTVAQQAAMWRSVMEWGGNAYFPGTPSTALSWDRYGERWTLTTRTFPKEWGTRTQAMIAPLGAYAEEGTAEEPRFVGYLIDETTPRPVLILSAGGEPFRFEGDFVEA